MVGKSLVVGLQRGDDGLTWMQGMVIGGGCREQPGGVGVLPVQPYGRAMASGRVLCQLGDRKLLQESMTFVRACLASHTNILRLRIVALAKRGVARRVRLQRVIYAAVMPRAQYDAWLPLTGMRGSELRT